jgi:2-oxoglutarate ferredoxin oxidoreductase subunit delta
MAVTIRPALPDDVVPTVSEMFVPVEIATERCKGCALCVEVCPKRVLALDDATVNALGHHPVRLTDPSDCTSCVLCARICPDAVLSVYARVRRA